MNHNPLTDHRSPQSGNWPVGEARSFFTKGPDAQVTRTTTIIRTERPFVHDLADAYNASSTRPDVKWFADGGGSLQLGSNAPFRPQPEWKADDGETEWIGRAVAEYASRYPDRNPLMAHADDEHFRATMNRWHAAAPWRIRDI